MLSLEFQAARYCKCKLGVSFEDSLYYQFFETPHSARLPRLRPDTGCKDLCTSKTANELMLKYNFGLLPSLLNFFKYIVAQDGSSSARNAQFVVSEVRLEFPNGSLYTRYTPEGVLYTSVGHINTTTEYASASNLDPVYDVLLRPFIFMKGAVHFRLIVITSLAKTNTLNSISLLEAVPHIKIKSSQITYEQNIRLRIFWKSGNHRNDFVDTVDEQAPSFE